MKTINVLIILLALNACNKPSTTEKTSAKETSATERNIELAKPDQQSVDTTSNQVATDTVGQVVYVTHDGNKYHTADCRYAKSGHSVKLNQAKADGKSACDLCKPNSKTGDKQIRCSAKTKEGKQCQRMTTDASGKCFQHKG